ncbi:probable Arabinogalactan endo-1,4-beta-galactosidase [Cephalotrichum gorgonifer]|uniref:Arabinogalactan endo-beta-1,4-galactanase n=1 Tax=Cephalotrichum gorgonifer TaxID=2041049 RepID=A0AAE8MS85_9PEZI|nr:probable Arabinogalactan endo-1,4-beta-galactosidase [Cephalotrichum gorgonifer]
MKLLYLLFAGLASAALRHVGVDWSSLLIEERAGISYQDPSGTTLPLEKILVASGVDTVRQRIWVNPADGNYNLEYNLQLARRANAAGLKVYLDFHYSDNWADPGKQHAPAGWPQEIGALERKLYEYTLSVCNAFAQAGIVPAIISIGNEIRTGMLWPVGSTDGNKFGNVARLLRVASRGVRESSLGNRPKIMVHIDNGWDWGLQEWWYESVLAAGGFELGDFDQMGVSYYPFYNSGATLASLRTSLQNMARRWGKEVVVAEVNWPVQCSRPAYAFPADLRDIPFSWQGQADFLRKVASATEGAGGAGIFYWEPAWVDNAGLGSSCERNTMFEWPGKGLPSLNVFKEL